MNIKRLAKELIKHPLKSINLIGLEIFSKFKPLRMRFYPSFIAVEPTINCNLRCIMCHIDSLKREKKELLFEDFKKIIDKMPYTRVIDLQGIGEPFLCKDFFRMAEYANKKGVRVYTFTNANLINKDIAEKITNSNLEQLNISIDGATKNTYEKIRRGANFDVLIKNIKYLFSIRNPKKLKIIAWIVPNSINFDELEDIVKLCNELGFDRIVIQSKLTVYSYKKEIYKQNKELSLNNEEKFNLKLSELKGKFKNIEILREKTFSGKNHCKWPWTSLFISTDGAVIPCCIISDPSTANFGNIFETSFKQIWNNQQYMEFRKSIKENKIPFYCLDCYK